MLKEMLENFDEFAVDFFKVVVNKITTLPIFIAYAIAFVYHGDWEQIFAIIGILGLTTIMTVLYEENLDKNEKINRTFWLVIILSAMLLAPSYFFGVPGALATAVLLYGSYKDYKNNS